jgi:hypothetical protein
MLSLSCWVSVRHLKSIGNIQGQIQVSVEPYIGQLYFQHELYHNIFISYLRCVQN